MNADLCRFANNNYNMNATDRLIVTLVVVVSILLQCRAAPAPAADKVLKSLRSLTSFRVRRQNFCTIVHFPPPNEHIYCCQLDDDCQCPRRMGICAPDTAAAASSSSSASSALSLIGRVFGW